MGRGLPAGQSESRAPLALIGPEEFTRRAWPSEDPIGQRVGFDWDADGNFRWREVVGVIRHQKKHYDLSTIGREQVYFPVGIYGVISYSVAQRAHEIGVCMALGARSQDVVTMVLKQGVGLVAIGLGVGTAAAFALTRVMQTLLFEVSASDPVTYVVVGAILLEVGTAASLLPARRATRVEALSVLTTE